jgi:anti-anti-sigma regulatory factor
MWLMLFDLHQALGEKREFEARSLEFAMKFQRTAPVWRGEEPVGDPATLQAGGGAFISLTGKLSAESAAQMEKVRAVAEKNRMLRLDFSRLQGADGAGCRVLLELLQAIRKRGCDAMFTGDGVLLGALAHATKPGAKDVAQSLWLLRLEILQWQGRQKEFDDVALDYAVTYEESPPSFESAARATVSAPVAAAELADGALKAPKLVTQNDAGFLGGIEEAARTRKLVLLDFSDTLRMDFATAGKLLNLVTNLHAHGKRLEIRYPSALVCALLDVVGATALASVVQRK